MMHEAVFAAKNELERQLEALHAGSLSEADFQRQLSVTENPGWEIGYDIEPETVTRLQTDAKGG